MWLSLAPPPPPEPSFVAPAHPALGHIPSLPRHPLTHPPPLLQASGTHDGRTLLWDMTRGSLIKEWQSHQERVWALSMDDYHVVSAGLDTRVCVRSFRPADLRFNRCVGGPSHKPRGVPNTDLILTQVSQQKAIMPWAIV